MNEEERRAADDRAPRRILLFAGSPYMGGITSHIVSVVRAFADSAEWDVSVAALPGRRGDNTLLEECNALGCPVMVPGMSSAWDLGILERFRDYTRQEQFHLVHAHNYRATLVASMAAVPAPVVSTCHGRATDPSVKVRFWQRLELRALRRAPLTIACSRYVREWLVSKRVPPDRVRVVHNAAASPPSRAQPVARDVLGVAPGKLLAVYAGRLVQGKGLEHLVDAAGRAPWLTVLLVGAGPLSEGLRARAAARGADVRLPGSTSGLSPLYSTADVVVLPSRMEAFPMTLVEAAAHGKPVVACPVGGVPEVVEDGATGLTTPFGDADALCAALERLRDPELRARLGNNARQVWRERFSLPVMRASLEHAYREALTRWTARGPRGTGATP